MKKNKQREKEQTNEQTNERTNKYSWSGIPYIVSISNQFQITDKLNSSWHRSTSVYTFRFRLIYALLPNKSCTILPAHIFELSWATQMPNIPWEYLHYILHSYLAIHTHTHTQSNLNGPSKSHLLFVGFMIFDEKRINNWKNTKHTVKIYKIVSIIGERFCRGEKKERVWSTHWYTQSHVSAYSELETCVQTNAHHLWTIAIRLSRSIFETIVCLYFVYRHFSWILIFCWHFVWNFGNITQAITLLTPFHLMFDGGKQWYGSNSQTNVPHLLEYWAIENKKKKTKKKQQTLSSTMSNRSCNAWNDGKCREVTKKCCAENHFLTWHKHT